MPHGEEKSSPHRANKAEHCCSALHLAFLTVTLIEFLDAPTGRHRALLAGKERMALRTYVDTQIFFSRSGGKGTAAAAGYGCFAVFRVDLFFHVSCTSLYYSRVDSR